MKKTRNKNYSDSIPNCIGFFVTEDYCKKVMNDVIDGYNHLKSNKNYKKYKQIKKENVGRIKNDIESGNCDEDIVNIYLSAYHDFCRIISA